MSEQVHVIYDAMFKCMIYVVLLMWSVLYSL